jgi:hypothetical protein
MAFNNVSRSFQLRFPGYENKTSIIFFKVLSTCNKAVNNVSEAFSASIFRVKINQVMRGGDVGTSHIVVSWIPTPVDVPTNSSGLSPCNMIVNDVSKALSTSIFRVQK